MKRLTIDLPPELHRKFKLYCLTHGLQMADVIREFIEKAVSFTKKAVKL